MCASLAVVAVILFSSLGALPHVSAATNTITNGLFSPSDNVVGTYTFYSVKFELGTTGNISNIVLTWPSGYNVASEKFVFSNGVPAGTTTATNGPPVTITYCFGSASCTSGGGTPTKETSGDVVTFMFANIENPTTAGSYTPTSICSYDLKTQVECQTSLPAITISDITSSDLASSITIAALTAGTLSVTGTSAFSGAATFASTVTTTGLLTASGGISTTNIAASGTLSVTGAASFSGAVTTTGLLTASGGITTPDATIGSMSLSSNTISTSSSTLAVYSADGQLWVGDGVSYPLVLFNDTGNVMAYFYSSGSYEEFINLGDLWTGGNLYAAGGLFAVNTSGQITTESCGFYCLDGSSLPNWWAESQSSTTTTASYAPGRNAVALVFITVDIQSPVNGANADIGVTLQNSYPDNSGITIEPESVHAFYIPTGAEMSVTYEFYVYGFTAQTGAGTFSSVLSTCNVGPACGGSWNTAWGIYDNFINVIWLPE